MTKDMPQLLGQLYHFPKRYKENIMEPTQKKNNLKK